MLTFVAESESAEEFFAVIANARLVGNDVRRDATAAILTELSISIIEASSSARVDLHLLLLLLLLHDARHLWREHALVQSVVLLEARGVRVRSQLVQVLELFLVLELRLILAVVLAHLCL